MNGDVIHHKHMSIDFTITNGEMYDALKRSGYLLESEITAALATSGFFVESGQVIQDPITGKSREIDLMAEHHDPRKKGYEFKGAAKIKFIFEIKNNLFPVVLLTRFESSPNIEDWIGLKEALNRPCGVKYESHKSYYESLIADRNEQIYTQYCSFHKKKENDELMALHPENIHSGLMKITHYCEEQVELVDTDLVYDVPEESDKRDGYFRHFLFMPVLLINDDLYELKNDELEKIDSSILVYNYHYKNEPRMAYVFVVTKRGFPEFIEKMVNLEAVAERLMFEASNNGV